jgi:hypothetical protein
MADKKTRRLPPDVLQADLDAYAALEAMEDYNPANADFSLANGAAAKTGMQGKQTKEVQDAATANASRDAAVIGEWDFHEFVLGAKIQVKAQYGESSDQVAAVGLKKKSEYKTPKKKTSSQN